MIKKLVGAAFLGSLAIAQNIVVNPGFESGFSPWVVQNWSSSSVASNGVLPNTGTTFAYTGCEGAACIAPPPAAAGAWLYQDLATTPGATYTLTFFFTPGRSAASGNNADLQVLWGPAATALTTGGAGACTGNCVFENTTIGTTAYTQYTVNNLTATSATTRIMFLGRQDPFNNGLDDIAVVRVSGPGVPGTPVPPSIWLTLIGIGSLGIYFAWRNKTQKA